MAESLKEQLKTLIGLASADNSLAENEMKFIHHIGHANGFTGEEIEEMMKNPEPLGDLSSFTADQKFETLYNVVQLMKVDKKVFLSEIKYSQDMADKLGFKKTVIAELSSQIYSDPSITGDKEELKQKALKFLK
ncbi:MAG: TerB family tellurite resistance protein [Bacteroidota bacterium]